MRLLVAYDGTDGAEAALRAAAMFADLGPVEMIVLRVLNPLTNAHDVVAGTTRDAMEQVATEARREMDARLKTLRVTADVRVETLARGEDVAPHIVRVARDEAVDLVVIASRRAGGLLGAVLGSVASAVVRHSPCPVLIVRPDPTA